MKTKRKLTIVLAVLVLVVPLTILLGINLYIQSPRFQTTLEDSLADRWGIKLDLQEATFTPWGGLNAKGVCAAATGTSNHVTLLHAGLKVFPLLQRRIVLNNVQLHQPYAEWLVGAPTPDVAQQASVNLPSEKPQQLAAMDQEMSRIRTASLSASPETATTISTLEKGPISHGASPATSTSSSTSDFQVTIQDLEVIDGQLVVREGVSQPPLLQLEGVNLAMTSLVHGEFRGEILVEQVQLMNSLALKNVSSPMTYRENELDFAKIAANLAGGEVHGALKLQQLDSRAQFDLQVDYYKLELSRLLEGVGKQLSFEKGLVEGGVRLAGVVDEIENSDGTGEIIITGVRMGDDTFLSSIGQLFGISELKNLHARQIVLSARMGDGTVHLQRARLESDNIVCNATGELRGAGKMDFQVQLMLHETLQKKIPASFLQGFKGMEESDFTCLDFVVLGDLDTPRTDLLDRLFPNKDIPVGNLLKLLFPQQNWYVSASEEEKG